MVCKHGGVGEEALLQGIWRVHEQGGGGYRNPLAHLRVFSLALPCPWHHLLPSDITCCPLGEQWAHEWLASQRT